MQHVWDFLSYCWWKQSTYVKHFNWLARIISCWGQIPYVTSNIWFHILSNHHINLQHRIDVSWHMGCSLTLIQSCHIKLQHWIYVFQTYAMVAILDFRCKILPSQDLKCWSMTWIRVDESKVHQTLDHVFGAIKWQQLKWLHHWPLIWNANIDFKLNSDWFNHVHQTTTFCQCLPEHRVASFIFQSYILQLQDLKG